MTEGKSEDMLFYGAAGQFVQKLSEASALCICLIACTHRTRDVQPL